jgi:hypothetical protein
METFPSTKVRIFRCKEKMLNTLVEYEKSNLSIKAFCIENNISPATFHYWKKKYNGSTVNQHKQSGFTALHLTTPSPAAIFADVNGIKIYQWVEPAYLKALLL